MTGHVADAWGTVGCRAVTYHSGGKVGSDAGLKDPIVKRFQKSKSENIANALPSMWAPEAEASGAPQVFER